MFKLSRKFTILRASIIGCLVVAVLSALSYFIISQHDSTSAASQTGDNVTITSEMEDTVHYGDGGSTRQYKVSVNGGPIILSYCVQPPQGLPNGNGKVEKLATSYTDYPEMKLIIFLHQYTGSESSIVTLRNTVFSHWGLQVNMNNNVDMPYAWTHVVLGYMYYDHYTGDLTNSDVTAITSTITTLRNSIQQNSRAWQMAQHYSLYISPNEGRRYSLNNKVVQDVMWIEQDNSLGSISVQKCDAETNSCTTPQGNASFSGITVKVYNNSGHEVYNPSNNTFYANGAEMASGTTNASGQVTFSNLPANNVTYSVKETATNSTYQLTATAQNATLSSNGQTASVKLYNNINRGSITVQKRDSQTGTTPQGNASLAGITIELRNGSSSTIYVNNQAYAANEVIATKTTDATGKVSFTGLPATGITYKIKETATNSTYDLTDSTEKTTTLSTNGQSQTITITDNVKRGNITVNKTDKETGTCTTSSELLSLTGTKFQLTNTSTNTIYYNNTSYAPNAVITTATLAANQCSVSFNNLPYGTYELKELTAGVGYALDSTAKTITIPTNNNANVTYTFPNQPIRGDLRFVKKDGTNNTVMPNAVFSISSVDSNQQVKETHVVVADQNGVVDTRNSINQHSNHTNGYDSLYDSADAPLAYSSYGTWFGLNRSGQPIAVNDSVGALPYGTYIIQELRCDANMFCSGIINEKVTFQITTHGQVRDLGDWDNTCALFSIETVATDNKDGDKHIEISKSEVIKDTINYCAKKNYTFTIKGILMDKTTGEPLLVNGETVEQSLEITPETDCGTAEMLFPVDTSELAGHSIVVFEELYYKNELKASHKDINDEDQTIDILSLGTIAVDNADEDKFIELGEETEIKDTVSYCAKKDHTYIIVGTLIDKTTGNPITIDGETITQNVRFTAEENCGTVEMLFPIDTSKISAHPIVVFEKLYAPGQGDGEFVEILSHEDLEDEDQTVYVISLNTTVKNDEDGDKVFPRDSDITVTDTVHYCLKPGVEYTVKGIIMDKSTGNGLLVNSALVEQSVTFTPTEACGEIDMLYTFNTTGLGGAQLVVFESLYLDNELILEHKNLDNEPESFEIDINVPDTGYITSKSSDGQSASHFLLIAVIAIAPIGIYTINRRQARKRFLGK